MDFRPVRPARPISRGMGTAAPQRRAPTTVAPTPAPTPKPRPVEQPPTLPVAQHAPAKKPKKVEKKSRKWSSVVRATLLVVVLACITGWFAWSEVKNSATGIDTSRYQAVFLEDGQVYFGKLEPFNDKSMKLKNIYYLQQENGNGENPENPQQPSDSQTDVELVKLGEELHGPEDEMIIMLEQLLFYENLKSDSKVAELIEQHKKSR